ncbi:MAG: hypothetical protein LBH54_04800 [Clostridiales bacterium]|jgi:hypothetical protein|nr:hypothetical protein [Clostridiales bacterium]
MSPVLPESSLESKRLDEILGKKPEIEEDKPFTSRAKMSENLSDCLIQLTNFRKTVNDGIKSNQSFTLIYICIAAIIFVYIIQPFLSADMELATTIIELLKAVIFSATGYVFAKNI